MPKELKKLGKAQAPAQHNPVGVQAMPPTTTVRVSKDQAGDVSIGDHVSISVVGVVQGIHRSYDGNGYELILESPSVNGIQGNSADKELKKMTRDMTKTITKELAKNPADHAWEDVRK